MIKQTLLVLVLLLSAHTVTHTRIAIFVPLILAGNWAYQHQMQMHKMHQRSLAAALGKPEKEIEKEYPPITVFDATTELFKRVANATQKALVAINTGDGPFNKLTTANTSPEEKFNKK